MHQHGLTGAISIVNICYLSETLSPNQKICRLIIKINGNPYHTRYINTKLQIKATQSLRISFSCEDNH